MGLGKDIKCNNERKNVLALFFRCTPLVLRILGVGLEKYGMNQRKRTHVHNLLKEINSDGLLLTNLTKATEESRV